MTFLKRIGSRKLALWLMGILVCFLLIGSIIPQENLVDPGYFDAWTTSNPALFRIVHGIGLTRTYTSWWFLSVLSILFLNTLVYTGEHLARLVRKRDDSVGFERLRSLLVAAEMTMPSGTSPERIQADTEAVLRRRRFTLYPSVQEHDVLAGKGRLNAYGVLLIHVAVLLVFIASTVTALTRFSGITEITEGQTVFDRPSNYVWTREAVFSEDSYNDFAISLVRFMPSYYPDGTIQSLKSDLILSDGSMKRWEHVAMSSPITFSGSTIYQRDVHGAACLFRLTDEDGSVLDNTYVLFDRQKEGNLLKTRYRLRNSIWFLAATLYPDAYTEGDERGSRSFLIRNPVLNYTVSADGRALSSGTLTPGGSVMIGKRKLIWRDVRSWSSYWITRDKGELIIFTAFLAGILGLLLIVLTEDKTILVSLVKDGALLRVQVRGKASRFPHLFREELSGIMKEISEEVSR